MRFNVAGIWFLNNGRETKLNYTVTNEHSITVKENGALTFGIY